MKCIYFIAVLLEFVMLAGLISCKKGNEEAAIAAVSFREDTTYAKGPDLTHNIEKFDAAKTARAVEAFQDREFKKGMILYSPTEGSLVEEVRLNFGYTITGTPFWTLAQWASKFSLRDAQVQILSNSDRVYMNVAKTFATNPDGSFQMALMGQQEYGTHVKLPGESWPHLYLSQAIYPTTKIPIAKCENIYFSLDAIRECCNNYMSKEVNLTSHTAHTVINLTIQNRKTGTPTFGQYYIIQLPCYDYRYDYPKSINAYDSGGKEVFTGALMYGMSGDKLWNGTFKDGKWHIARKDILPIILEAWPIATKVGTKLESADINDFYLATISIGWEVSGIFNCSMRFKNFSIKAVINP